MVGKSPKDYRAGEKEEKETNRGEPGPEVQRSVAPGLLAIANSQPDVACLLLALEANGQLPPGLIRGQLNAFSRGKMKIGGSYTRRRSRLPR